MPDSAEKEWPAFNECIVNRGGDKPPLRFHGRVYAEAQRARANSTLHRALVYQTSDGRFVSVRSVIQDHGNQQRTGHDDGENFETLDRACAWFGDKELGTELFEKATERALTLSPLEDPTYLRDLARKKILGGFLPANPDTAIWKPKVGPVGHHHPEQNTTCHLCAVHIKIGSDTIPDWYWLSDISEVPNPPPENAHPKLHFRCHRIWHSVAREMADPDDRIDY